MNWRIVIPLGLTGLAPPLVLTALRAAPALAAALWTVLAAAVWVPVVLRARDPRPLATLLLVGVIAGVAAGLVDGARTGDPMLVFVGVLLGAVWGAIFGGVATAIQRIRGPPPA